MSLTMGNGSLAFAGAVRLLELVSIEISIISSSLILILEFGFMHNLFITECGWEGVLSGMSH